MDYFLSIIPNSSNFSLTPTQLFRKITRDKREIKRFLGSRSLVLSAGNSIV